MGLNKLENKEILIKDKIKEYIENNKKWLIDKVKEVVSVNTINNPPFGNENNGQGVIEKIFKNMGVEIDRFSPDEVINFKKSELYPKNRNFKNRDNLVGIFGEGKKKTLIFNGHIDTVPSHNYKWTKTEPFKPELINGKIYGLGAGDQKGGLVSSIFALKTILDLDIPIKGKVIIESVIDEEFAGSNGSLACVKRGYEGDFAIITEPTFMDIGISNVCCRRIIIKIIGGKGLPYLGKIPDKENIIVIAARLINTLKDYEDYLNSLKGKYEIYKDIDKPINFLFSGIESGEVQSDKIGANPQECLIQVFSQNYPGISESEFTDRMIAFLKKYPDISKYIYNRSIIFNNANRFLEGGNFDLSVSKNNEFISRIIENGKKLTGRELKLGAFLGGCDFFTFSNYSNTPVIVLGAGGGNYHAADEYVDLKELVDTSKIYASLIYDYCC